MITVNATPLDVINACEVASNEIVKRGGIGFVLTLKSSMTIMCNCSYDAELKIVVGTRLLQSDTLYNSKNATIDTTEVKVRIADVSQQQWVQKYKT